MSMKFIFLNNESDVLHNDMCKNVLVSREVENESELFKLFATQLEFPDYFGENWDAFWDCLCDVSWISKKIINIIHRDVPFNHHSPNRKIYFEILHDLSLKLNEISDHYYKIYFLQIYKQKIEDILLYECKFNLIDDFKLSTFC